MLRSRRLFMQLLISGFVLLTIISFYSIWEALFFKDDGDTLAEVLKDTEGGRWRKLSTYKRETFSTLGRILFLGEPVPKIYSKRWQEKTILIWQYGLQLERRFIYRFSDKKHDPFNDCSVRCHLIYDHKALPTADAVIIPMHLGPWDQELESASLLSKRPSHQRWIFWSDESPKNIRHYLPKSASRLNSLFNWTMTYRMDSDIPVPYGRTIFNADKASEFELAAGPPSRSRGRKKHLVAALISNCHSKPRLAYIDELAKHVTVHFYGNCGDRNCTNHFDTDCPILQNYSFILAFENSFCAEYITEKTWWNAFYHGSIPVILGPSWHQCIHHLPPGSFLHVDSYPIPAALGRHLIRLASQPATLASFQAWRRRYLVVQEHGYFGSAATHYCRVCQALYYNSPEKKVYEDLELFWSESDCRLEIVSYNNKSIKS